MKEEWRKIPGWPSYEVSSLGRMKLKPAYDDPWKSIRGIRVDGQPRQRRTRLRKGTSGNVALRKDGKTYWFRIAQLILLAFVGPPEDGHVARHLDDDPRNNKLSNLAWGTPQDNYNDAVRNGRSGPGTPGAQLRGLKLKGRPRPQYVRDKISAGRRRGQPHA